MENFGRQLTQNLQEQGRAIEQQAKRYAEQAKQEERKREAELQSKNVWIYNIFEKNSNVFLFQS